MNKNELAAALTDAMAPNLTWDHCYMVMPRKDSLHICIVLADPGQAGYDAIARAFPDLAVAFSGNELLRVVDDGLRLPVHQAGLHWFKPTCLYDFVVVQDGKPTGRVIIRATGVSKALKKASRLHPDCHFSPLGSLDGNLKALQWIERMVNDDNPFLVDTDLRS